MDDQIMPPSSSSLWGDMLGLGPLIKTITDPNLGMHAHAMIRAIMESAQASARMEAKLDAVLKALGHDTGNAAASGPIAGPLLLAADGPDGIGRPSAASGAADGGIAGTAKDHRRPHRKAM